MTKILYGAPVAEKIKDYTVSMIEDSHAYGYQPPYLRIITIGDDEASKVYIRSKCRACDELKVKYDVVNIDPQLSVTEKLDKIEELAGADEATGVFVQLPTGNKWLDKVIPQVIPPKKDVDGLTAQSLGGLMSGAPFGRCDATIAPATPKGIESMLSYYDVPLKGKVVGIIGRSLLVGKPLAQLMLDHNATVISMHSHSDIEALAPLCDVLIVAVGKPKLINSKHLKQGAVVIDVGINREDGKLVGDCDFDEIIASDKASAISPVPKGVGVTTVASLLYNLAFLTWMNS